MTKEIKVNNFEEIKKFIESSIDNLTEEHMELYNFLKGKEPSQKNILSFDYILENYKNGQFKDIESNLYRMLEDLDSAQVIKIYATSSKNPKMLYVWNVR